MRGRLPIKNMLVAERQEPDPYYVGKDLYALREGLTGWRNWLQKKLFRILARLGCHANKPMMSVVYRNPVDPAKPIIDRMMTVVEAQAMLNGKANTVLIGPDTWSELMNDHHLNASWISMNATAEAGYGHSRTILGLDVHIVPEIEGFIVIPGRITSDGRYLPDEMNGFGVSRGGPEVYEMMRRRSCEPLR